MNEVWLCPCPGPGRAEDDKTIDASFIRALQTWDLPWRERQQGPHHWALYAHVAGGPEPHVEVLRGADAQVRRTVARRLARILAAERAAYPGSAAVTVSIGEETPQGFVFHVDRETSPGEPRLWWPLEYQQRIEDQESETRKDDMGDPPFLGDVDSRTFWGWPVDGVESSVSEGEEGEERKLRPGRLPWDPPEH